MMAWRVLKINQDSYLLPKDGLLQAQFTILKDEVSRKHKRCLFLLRYMEDFCPADLWIAK
jgi:hypothetical protein